MKRLEITVPLRLIEDLGILSEQFFRNNESVEVLQSFSVRPQVAGLFVRVRRRGPFKNPETVRREARSIQNRYHLERFEVLSADARLGYYDSPAKVPLDRIAGLVGISRAGLSKHLRVAECKLLDAALGH